MYTASPQQTVALANERAIFLRKVGIFTFLGLLVAAVTGVASMFFVAPFVIEAVGGYGVLGVVLLTFFAAHYGARAIVYRSNAKVAGLLFGSVCEGIALGFLLLVTVIRLGALNGMLTILQCLTLTVFTGLGMLLYTLTAKRELSLVRAGLAAIGLPMLVLMVLAFVFPIGGPIGIAIALFFVVVSAAALLYRLNAVVRSYPDHAHVEGAYELTMSLLVLFWNLLSLLNRVRR
jgi:FtsH-binding integral membrane protein